MRVSLRVLRMVPAVAAGFLLAGCGGNANPALVTNAGNEAPAEALRPAFTQPALIAFDTENGSLAYWPIRHDGGRTLTSITGALGIHDGYALAANGSVVVIGNYDPAVVLTYNVKTKAKTTMGDPYGGPLDVAVGKDGTIYAMNIASVAVYRHGSGTPSQLTCADVNIAEAIAVNNEGDVFVDGYGPGSFQGVVEYPSGSTKCTVPHLRPSQGYIAGVGIDPKTDDLIVIDDPDLCAGGLEGRMVIYPKPYERRNSFRHDLQATYCSGTFRLDSGSKHIFYSDATVSDAFPLIDQARYPSGKYEGQYENGYYSGGNFAGFTTIPNALPN
jgi:hypothetical protein